MKHIASLFACTAAALLPLAVAEGAAPGGNALPVPADDEVVEIIGNSAASRARQQRQNHSPLNGILVFVYDRATADAAAPRVKELLASPEGKNVEEPLLTLAHVVERMDCYGSDALREALRPVLDERELVDSPELKQFRELALPIVDEMNALTVSITQLLEAVTDKDSAARAAEALSVSYAPMAELSARLQASGEQIRLGMGDMYRVAAIMNERRERIADRFLHAYAHAQSRPGGPFPELAEAIMGEGTADMSEEQQMMMRQQLEPSYLMHCERSANALREWLALASGISDKASADAAADWLEQKSAELGFPSGTCWHDYASNKLYHHCMYQLARVLENTTAYFYYAQPSYFGSEKLKAQFPPAPGNIHIGEPEEAE